MSDLKTEARFTRHMSNKDDHLRCLQILKFVEVPKIIEGPKFVHGANPQGKLLPSATKIKMEESDVHTKRLRSRSSKLTMTIASGTSRQMVSGNHWAAYANYG